MAKQVFYYAQADIHIDRVDSIGPGDADINTQSGRSTNIRVYTHTPTPTRGATSIEFTLEYWLREGRRDHTTLSAKRSIRIQLPWGYRWHSFGAGYVDARLNETIDGKQHGWIDISDYPALAGTALDSCQIKTDGKGDDDRGNARLMAHVMVPLVVDVEAENPSIPGTTSSGTTMLDPKMFTFDASDNPRSNPRQRALVRGLGPVLYSVVSVPADS